MAFLGLVIAVFGIVRYRSALSTVHQKIATTNAVIFSVTCAGASKLHECRMFVVFTSCGFWSKIFWPFQGKSVWYGKKRIFMASWFLEMMVIAHNCSKVLDQQAQRLSSCPYFPYPCFSHGKKLDD